MKQEYIILIARTSVFFSKCDNDYDERERKFIQNYIENFELVTKVEDSTKDTLMKIEDEELSIEGIISQTKKYISQLSETEAKQTISDLEMVINKVIEIDGVLANEEVEYFEIWKKELKG